MKDLLLLHGALGSRQQMELLKGQLSSLFHVHVPEFPGHGNSPFDSEFSIPAFADHVEQYCFSKGIESVSIFGYSMGGYVALYLARKNPSLVERIVTLATKFHWDEETANREAKMLDPNVIMNKVPVLGNTLIQRHGEQKWKKVLHKTSEMMKELGANNALITGDYTSISIPVLLMLGDRDKMVGFDETIETYRKLPGAQLAVLPGTPHPMEQAPIEHVIFFIQQFLH